MTDQIMVDIYIEDLQDFLDHVLWEETRLERLENTNSSNPDENYPHPLQTPTGCVEPEK